MRKSRIILAAAAGLLAAGLWAAPPSQCLTCHDSLKLAPTGEAHMRLGGFEVQGHAVGCEGCHDGGEAAAHAEGGDASKIRTFGKDAAADSRACLSCHGPKGMSAFKAGTHADEDVGCTNCHRIHGPEAPEQTCAACHADVAAAFRLPSHHPVDKGQMTCASCHQVHGNRESLLTSTARRNDLCFSCHPSQEGPFIFEHQPAIEDCGICHAPHGTVANNLLLVNEPTLCLQCHEMHFHTGLRAGAGSTQTVGGATFENPYGVRGFSVGFLSKCTQCHKPHGSDLPSQGVSGQGGNLTR